MADEENTKDTSVPKVGSGMPKAVLVVLIVVGVLVLMGLIYYTKNSLLVSDDVAVTSENGGNTVTVTSDDGEVKISNNQQWPDTMPSVVPEFTAGDVSASSRVSDTWSVQVDNVTKGELDVYKVDLESAGWEITSEISVSSAESWLATKDNYTLSATLSIDENSLIISVGSQTE